MGRANANVKEQDKNSSVDNGNKNSFHGKGECKNDVESMIECPKSFEEVSQACVKVNRYMTYQETHKEN